jgi:hypothetical protein
MVESWRLQCTRAGAIVPVRSFSPELGIVFADDGSDVFGRGIAVGVNGAWSGQQTRLEQYASDQGLDVAALPFSLDVDGGDLVFNVQAEDPLPDGLYELTCLVAGSLTSVARLRFEIDGGAPATIAVPLDPWVPLTVTVQSPAACDPLVRRLLESGSKIDGVDVWEWLNDPHNDPQRRACVFNLIAKLRCTPWVDGTSPLITHVQAIMGAQVERMYVALDDGLNGDGAVLSSAAFIRDPGEPEPMHFRLVDWVHTKRTPPDPGDSQLISYRQRSTHNSLQVVYAVPDATHGHPAAGSYGDVDIDLGGSTTDIVGFFIHMGELEGDAVITDHLELYYHLYQDKNDPIANYAYYSLPPKG